MSVLLFCKTKYIKKGTEGNWGKGPECYAESKDMESKGKRISRWTLSWTCKQGKKIGILMFSYSENLNERTTANSCWLIFSPFKIPAAAAARQFFKDMVKGFCKSLYTINQYGENLECSSQQLRIPWAFPNWCFFGSLPVAVISRQRGQITCTTHSLNSRRAAVWPKSAMGQCLLKWQNSPYLPVRFRPGIHD